VIRLAIRVPRERAELVLAELLELTPAGVEEVQIDSETVEYAVYGAPGELPSLPDVTAVAGGSTVDIATSELADDWHERWKDFHRPVLIAAPEPASTGGALVSSLLVRPPWEDPATTADAGLQEIVIDPGQAFGTGGHASTRLCLELMLELSAGEQQAGAVLDVGTGSGVLAIAAAKLGYGPLLGLDNELESVQAAGENAIVNGVELETRRYELRSEELPWQGEAETPPGPLLMTANLLRPLLLELVGRLERPPAHLIASGLLTTELDEVAGAFVERLGMCERKRLRSGEWAAVWLSSPS
jgi:ribosomal protein L11 methyltransferase